MSLIDHVRRMLKKMRRGRDPLGSPAGIGPRRLPSVADDWNIPTRYQPHLDPLYQAFHPDWQPQPIRSTFTTTPRPGTGVH